MARQSYQGKGKWVWDDYAGDFIAMPRSGIYHFHTGQNTVNQTTRALLCSHKEKIKQDLNVQVEEYSRKN